jgi:formylglycine-generating enzyme required for sulfatase activity
VVNSPRSAGSWGIALGSLNWGHIMNRCNWTVLMGILISVAANAAQPVVSNVRASQRSGTKLVDIYYDVSDVDGHAQTVQVYVSGDNGLTFRIPAVTFTGSVGANVTPGANKHIVWDAGRDWNGQFVESTKVRIVCNDGTTPVPPFNMVYIPAGPFQMGDALSEENDDAKPVHSVHVDGFFMDKFEVARDLWTDVRTWANANGYSMGGGSARAPGHPIQRVNWYSAVLWCNARSEKEGLTPVYYNDASQTSVARTSFSGHPACVKWIANGYRLPTEAEWEKAARGTRFGNRYPWGNSIDGTMANYGGSGDPFENTAPMTAPCGYYNGGQSPAGVDMANGYGVYDVSGNVKEWCWDNYGITYYGTPESLENPRGPSSGSVRVVRGGGWGDGTGALRCARRDTGVPPTADYYEDVGFRCVRGQ